MRALAIALYSAGVGAAETSSGACDALGVQTVTRCLSDCAECEYRLDMYAGVLGCCTGEDGVKAKQSIQETCAYGPDVMQVSALDPGGGAASKHCRYTTSCTSGLTPPGHDCGFAVLSKRVPDFRPAAAAATAAAHRTVQLAHRADTATSSSVAKSIENPSQVDDTADIVSRCFVLQLHRHSRISVGSGDAAGPRLRRQHRVRR